MGQRQDPARGYTRRGVLGASAGLGLSVIGGPAALAATTQDRTAGRAMRARADRGDEGAGPDDSHVQGDNDRPRAGDAAEDGQVWGVSESGQGIGVRGNGRAGVRGEGIHTGVAGDGFVGVHGNTSIIDGDGIGVGVLAQTQVPGHLALRADGPSRFNGAVEFDGSTAFSRSGSLTVRPGKTSVTKTGVTLSDATIVLATLQTRVPGVYVHAVQADPAAESFTIYLTRAPGTSVSIGWIALG